MTDTETLIEQRAEQYVETTGLSENRAAVMARRNAGWDDTEIADDVGMSEGLVGLMVDQVQERVDQSRALLELADTPIEADGTDEEVDAEEYVCGYPTGEDSSCQNPVPDPDDLCHLHPPEGAEPNDG